MIFPSPLVQRHQTIKSTFARLISYFLSFFFLHTHIQKGTSKLLGALPCFTSPCVLYNYATHNRTGNSFYVHLHLAKYVPQCITRDCLHQTCLSTLEFLPVDVKTPCSRRNKSKPLTTGHDTEKNSSHN